MEARNAGAASLFSAFLLFALNARADPIYPYVSSEQVIIYELFTPVTIVTTLFPLAICAIAAVSFLLLRRFRGKNALHHI